MLKQSSARVSSSLRGAQALRSRCGYFLRGLFSHMQQHNAGGTKKKKKKEKAVSHHQQDHFHRRLKYLPWTFLQAQRRDVLVGTFFFKLLFSCFFNWSGPDRGAASYELRSCWEWDIVPSAHFHGLQSLNLSMPLLRQDDCSLRHVVSVRSINNQGGVEEPTSDRRHLIRAQDSEKPPGTKAW